MRENLHGKLLYNRRKGIYMQYDSNKIAAQITKRRKEMGLTQEDLAEMLSVTPQAISKWERGAGMPDITLLPDIAVSLGLSMDELFGKTKLEEGIHYYFPEVYQGLKRILTYQDLACYSDLEVQHMTDVFVSFTNGSSANLGTGELNFKGAGSIELVSADTFFDQYKQEYADQGISILTAKLADVSNNIVEVASDLTDELLGKSAQKEEDGLDVQPRPSFEGIDCLRINTSGCLDFEIAQNPEGIFRWGAPNLSEIKEDLEVYREDHTLVFRYKPHRDMVFFNFNFMRKNRHILRIELPTDFLRRLELEINGASDIRSEVNFAQSKLVVTGAGDVEALDLGASEIRVSGAGDIKAQHLGPAQIVLNGAGDVDIAEVSEKLEVTINGAGDLDIGQGAINQLNLHLTGAGDFKAKQLVTETAEITMSGAGNAVIGHIKGQSRERVSRTSTLKVLQRG